MNTDWDTLHAAQYSFHLASLPDAVKMRPTAAAAAAAGSERFVAHQSYDKAGVRTFAPDTSIPHKKNCHRGHVTT